MADPKEETPIPQGAQVMRKMYGALKALHGECVKAIGTMDESDAKTSISEHLDAIGGAVGGMEKAFSKLYKGIDLADQNGAEETQGDKPAEDKPADQPADDTPKKPTEPERQIKTDDADEDDELSPTEKSMLLGRIRQLETKVRHEERLKRAAALRGR